MKLVTTFSILVLLLIARSLPAQIITVWPGDANNNGEANAVDLLYLGLNYGATGPSRTSTSSNWLPYVAPTWGGPGMTGADEAYYDCDGNGNINIADHGVLKTNYGRTHFPMRPDTTSITSSVLAPSLSFTFPTDSFLSAQTYLIDVSLGSLGVPVDSLYGLAFTVEFDSSLVDTIYSDFSTSWLNAGGGSVLTIEKLNPTSLEIGITRTNHTNAIAAYGKVGGIVVVMVDNLKTSAAVASLKLSLPKLVGIRADGSIPQFIPISDSVEVFTSIYSPTPLPEFKIYPNPARAELRISTDWNLLPAGTLALVDVMGKVWAEAPVRNFIHTPIDVSGLPQGIYFISIVTDDKKWVQKIGVIR